MYTKQALRELGVTDQLDSTPRCIKVDRIISGEGSFARGPQGGLEAVGSLGDHGAASRI